MRARGRTRIPYQGSGGRRLEWGEELEPPIAEPVGKIEGAEPEEEKLFLSKEGEKPLLPRDRKELSEVSLLNGAAPPPRQFIWGVKASERVL
jgi:hypothetical protein